MGMSSTKSKSMCFCKSGHIDAHVFLNEIELEQVAEQRLLGLIMDENLTYQPHVELTKSKSISIIGKLNAFSHEIGGASTQVMLFLYNACTLSRLEYAYPVWSTCKTVESLNTVQYMAIRKALGAMDKSSASKMELLTHTLPLDIHLERSLILTFVRIHRLPENTPIRKLISALMNNPIHLNHKIITPIHKFKHALKYCIDFDINNVEKIHHESMEEILLSPIKIQSMEHNFGSAGSRSHTQSAAALKHALDYIALNSNDTIIYSDGSTLGNPGPTGAGVSIMWKGITARDTEYKRCVSNNSNNVHGELAALDLGLNVVNKTVFKPKHIHILSDCQSALKVVSSPVPPKYYSGLYYNILKQAKEITDKGTQITLKWIAGHVDLPGNDKADKLAKEAASEAKDMPDNSISMREAKAHINSRILLRWKNRCKTQGSSNLIPKASLKSYESNAITRRAEVRLHRLRLGNCQLLDHMNYILPDAFPSAICKCGKDRETINHYLMNCTLLNTERTIMIDTIERVFIRENTPLHSRIITTNSLLNPNDDLTEKVKFAISRAVSQYLESTAQNVSI